MESTYCFLYRHGYGTIHWSVCGSFRTTSLKKTYSHSASSPQLPIAPLFAESLHESFPRSLWVFWQVGSYRFEHAATTPIKCMCPVMPNKYCFAVGISSFKNHFFPQWDLTRLPFLWFLGIAGRLQTLSETHSGTFYREYPQPNHIQQASLLGRLD